MSATVDEVDDFHLITDEDFAKYSFDVGRYPWKRLSGPRSIRLLKIFSKIKSNTSDGETIECRLEEWDMDKASGKYEALSYAWGLPGNGFAYIQCDNVTTKIWRNLHQALLRLRDKISGGKRRRTRLIWVDALCIDQTDMAERQRQILLMKTIFGSASQVLIWLGEHDETSRQVWKSIEGVQPGSPMEMMRNAVQWNVKMHDAFVRRAWFRRVWTLQEVVLSSKATLLCGDDEMDWTVFGTIWRDRYVFMRNLRPELRESRTDHIQESLDFIGLMNCFDIHQHHSRDSNGSLKTLPLSEIIIRTWYRDATEAHDRIYALLGLVKIDNYANLGTPDYSQSPLELFVNITRTAILTDRMPALLNIAGLSPEDMPSPPSPRRTGRAAVTARRGESDASLRPLTNRPSWVPDWTKQGWEINWLTASLASDDSNARMHPDSHTFHIQSQSWTPIFKQNKLIIRGYILGHLPQRTFNRRPIPQDLSTSTYRVAGLWSSSGGRLRWANNNRLEDGAEYTIFNTRLPWDGATTRPGDVVCAFEGIRSLFVVRMLFEFGFGTYNALEWLKEDVQDRNLKLNCLLVGPVQVEGVELLEHPRFGSGDWEFVIN